MYQFIVLLKTMTNMLYLYENFNSLSTISNGLRRFAMNYFLISHNLTKLQEKSIL